MEDIARRRFLKLLTASPLLGYTAAGRLFVCTTDGRVSCFGETVPGTRLRTYPQADPESFIPPFVLIFPAY